jgi:hypothetical protein
MIFFLLELLGALCVVLLTIALIAIRSARIVGEEIDAELEDDRKTFKNEF